MDNVSEMSSSKLRKSITIQRREKEKDNDNIPIDVWKDLYTCRAFVENVSTNEYIQDVGVETIVSKVFYIRNIKRYKLNNKDRIVYNGRIYNIDPPEDLEEKGKYLKIKAKEIK